MRNATINRRLSLLRRAYQARVLFRYVKGLLKRPMLARLVVRETATEIELNTNASTRRARGRHPAYQRHRHSG